MNKERTEEFEGVLTPWYVRFIHKTLKDTFIVALKKAIILIPSNSRIDRYDKLTSSELQKQWQAMDAGIKKFNRQYKHNLLFGKHNRSNKAIKLIATIYFTILE